MRETCILICGGLLTALIPALTQEEIKGPKGLNVALKAACSLLFVLTGLWAALGAWSTYRVLMLAGLVLGMAGDVLLEMPGEKFFLPGMLAFLAGHVAYIAAFSCLAGWSYLSLAAALVTGTVLALLGRAAGARTGKLTVPVLVYMFTIALMVAAAHRAGHVTLVLGSLLFAFSDSVLAYGKFARPVRFGSSLVLGPYYTAQLLMALSMIFLS